MFSRKDIRGYLWLVARCQGSGTLKTGALLIAVNASGDIKFVALNDMMELRLQHIEYIKMQQELAYNYQIQRELDYSPQQEQKIGISISHSMDFEL